MKTFGVIIGTILAFVAVLGVSWIGTCGILKLVTMCFDLEFSWSIATGVWLCMCLLSSVFGGSRK